MSVSGGKLMGAVVIAMLELERELKSEDRELAQPMVNMSITACMSEAGDRGALSACRATLVTMFALKKGEASTSQREYLRRSQVAWASAPAVVNAYVAMVRASNEVARAEAMARGRV